MKIQALLIALIAAPVLPAQELVPDTAEIAPGDAVRITAPALGLDKWRGWYVSTGSDSVTVRGAADPSLVSFPLEKIARLEVNHGNVPPQGNAALGAAAGGLAGIFVGAIAADPANIDACVSSSEDAQCSPAQLRGGFYGLLVGMVLGAGIGALIRTQHWSDVPIYPPELTVSFPPGSYGAVGLTLRF